MKLHTPLFKKPYIELENEQEEELFKLDKDKEIERLKKQNENLEVMYQDIITQAEWHDEELKEEIERLKEEKEKLENIIIEINSEREELFNHLVNDKPQQRINEAIEYINKTPLKKGTEVYRIDLLNILQVSDKE